MHDHPKSQSDANNPYIQIMFNINSKKVVNNNILSEREKQLKFQMPYHIKPQKIDKMLIFPQKKPNPQFIAKSKKAVIKKSNGNGHKTNDLSQQKKFKNKKKPIKDSKYLSSINDTQKSVQNKNKFYENYTKPLSSQQAKFSSGKLSQQTRPKTKINKQLNIRQKIIELMIKDYQNGVISSQNFKQAISSLIEKQRSNKVNANKPQIKTQKSKTHISNSYKNSLTTSLRNTPRHRPSKSKSQKFYHPEISSNIQIKQNQDQKQPQIIQRIIDRKEFVNKIIIKGINSSLFLSNEFTDRDSPEKREIVQIKVINTSDSVKQLTKIMQKSVKKNIQQNNFFRKKQSNHQVFDIGSKIIEIQENAALTIQKAWKKYKTKKILNQILNQLEQNQHQKLQQSRLNFLSFEEKDNSLQYFRQNDNYSQLREDFNCKQNSDHKNQNRARLQNSNQIKSLLMIETANQADKNERCNQFDQFYIREDNESSQKNYSKIQQLQKQYALILKDNNDSRNLSSNMQSSFKQQQSQPQSQSPKEKLFAFISSQGQEKLKCYLSSELEKASNFNQKKAFSTKKQEVSQKRSKTIKQSEIKKLTQIIEIVKQQLTRNIDQQKQKKNSNPQILQKIANLLQTQKSDVQNELKIYNEFSEPLNHNDFLNSQNKNIIEQNQMINSFKKNLKKKNIFENSENLLTKEEPHVHYQSSKLQSINSAASLSHKSTYSSSNCSNHLQKTKISQLNLDYIQMGLKRRLHQIELKKQQQICLITQKFINDKINAKEYQEQKSIIQKWFNVQSKQLKKTKKKLIDGYKKVNEYLLKDELKYSNNLTRQKSNKMIKCISEKYFQKFDNNEQNQKDKRQITRSSKKTKQGKKSLKIKQGENDLKQLPKDQAIQLLQNQLLCKDKFQFPKISNEERQNLKIKSDLQPPQNTSLSPVSIQKSHEESSNSQIFKQSDFEEDQNEQRLENVISQNLEEQKQLRLFQPQKNQIKSQISSFLQKYQEQHDKSDESDEQQSQSSQILNGYSGYDDDVQNVQDDADEQSNGQYYYNGKATNVQNEDAEVYDQGSIAQLNIVLNVKAKAKFNQQEQLFSPKKTLSQEEFSSQLEEYMNENNSSNIVDASLQTLTSSVNQIMKRLRYLTEQDKDDIFQFMFLDLCLEIFLEQTKNNKIMKSIQNHLIYLRKKRKIAKGFKTGLTTSKCYVQNLVLFIKSNHLSSLKRLQLPMGPSAREMLKFMRDYEDSESENQEIINLILPIQIYQSYQTLSINRLNLERYYDDEQKQQSRLKFLNTLKHFHNKAIFDSLNQNLDHQRNYGVWGKPFPWKNALSVDRKFSDQQIIKKLAQAQQKIVENCSYLCGVLVDKEESVFGKTNVSEQYLRHIREDRMSKMLSNDMIDNEDRWIFYDDEETQVLIAISKYINAKIFSEMAEELVNITASKKNL